MAKNSGYLARQKAEREIREFQIRAHTRRWCLDMFTIAMGRLGYGEKRMGELEKVVSEVFLEYAELSEKDTADMEYTKACIDRELKRYCGELFVPYDERYRL